MSDEPRDQLHRLLLEHRDGLVSADLANGLGLSRPAVDTLLADEERQGFAVQAFVAEPVPRTIWKTTLTIAPAARGALVRPRPASGGGILIAALLVVALAAALVGLLLVRSVAEPPAPPAASPPAPPAPAVVPIVVPPVTSEEKVEARLQGSKAAIWAKERKELKEHIDVMDKAAAASGCEARWGAGEDCYVGARLMTSAAFREDRARMDLRVAELDGLIAAAR